MHKTAVNKRDWRAGSRRKDGKVFLCVIWKTRLGLVSFFRHRTYEKSIISNDIYIHIQLSLQHSLFPSLLTINFWPKRGGEKILTLVRLWFRLSDTLPSSPHITCAHTHIHKQMGFLSGTKHQQWSGKSSPSCVSGRKRRGWTFVGFLRLCGHHTKQPFFFLAPIPPLWRWYNYLRQAQVVGLLFSG